MSDLWDYDEDEDLVDGGTWDLPSPREVVVEHEENSTKKRKGGRKGGNAALRSKRRAPSPVAEEQQPLRPMVISLDSDDDEDLVVLPSPCRSGLTGTAGHVMEAAGLSSKSVISNLDPATQRALAKEHALLQALQQVTDMQHQPFDDLDPGPLQRQSRMPPVGLSRLTSRLPLDTRGIGAGTGTGTNASAERSGSGSLSVGAGVSGMAGSSYDNGGSHQPGTSDPDGATAAAAVAAAGAAAATAAPAAAADRVLLRLIWNSGKDCQLMRVVRTEPFSKMVEKFREIARQRSLCGDPNKIKFLFDGDDLAKMPNETPETLDMEDDMMIDVKL